MRTNTLIATLALGAGLFGGGALLVHAFAQDKAPRQRKPRLRPKPEP